MNRALKLTFLQLLPTSLSFLLWLPNEDKYGFLTYRSLNGFMIGSYDSTRLAFNLSFLFDIVTLLENERLCLCFLSYELLSL